MGNSLPCNGSDGTSTRSKGIRPQKLRNSTVNTTTNYAKGENHEEIENGPHKQSRKRSSITPTNNSEVKNMTTSSNENDVTFSSGRQSNNGEHNVRDHRPQEGTGSHHFQNSNPSTTTTFVMEVTARNPGKRATTASSIVLDERKPQEKSVSAQRRRRKSQGETDGGSDLSPRQEEKEQKELPATRNDNENYTSRSNGTSTWNKPITNPGPSHIRNEENEEERNRVLNAEPCTENLHTKPIPKGKKKRKRQELVALVKELTEEKNMLLNRLSEVGAMQLTENNPNITDLSNANRPEKLVEKFSDLYDNEWTDAYEDLTKTQGKQLFRSVELLLKILKEAYSTCLTSTKERATRLRQAMLSYAGLSDEDSSELELKEIEKKMREYRTKKSQCNVTRVQEEVKEKFKDETKMSNIMSLYIDGCVRICWFMCITNPPMHLDFDERENTTTTDYNTVVLRQFDKSKFVSYTKSGDYIDYVVWPAVYLHKDGPIMRKGVAQGFKNITDTLVDVKL